LPCCVLLSEHCKMCRRKKEYLTIFLHLTAHSNFFRLFLQMQWTDKDAKLLKTMSFPAILSTPVDASKIKLDVLRFFP
jgi:hypothetical protein